MSAGSTWRQEQENERAAWVVAHLLNVSGKTVRGRVTPKKLLHRPTPARDQQEWWDRVEKSRRKRLTEGG